MSVEKINLLKQYIHNNELNYKQSTTRRDSLKDLVRLLNNSCITLQNIDENNLSNLNLSNESSDWLKSVKNLNSFPLPKWKYRILKNGYVIEGLLENSFLIAIYIDGEKTDMYLSRSSSMVIRDNYSYPLKNSFLEQACKELGASYFEERNLITFTKLEVTAEFFEDIYEILINSLKKYEVLQNGVDEYFTNQKSSGALNWFDLDGNIFVSSKELSYQGYFFGEDIENISQFNEAYFKKYEIDQSDDLLLFLIHKNFPLARGYVYRPNLSHEENMLLTKNVINAFITAFKKYDIGGGASISTYANFWLLQAYTRSMAQIIRERCNLIYGIKPSFALIEQRRKQLREEIGKNPDIEKVIDALKGDLLEKISEIEEKEEAKKIQNFLLSSPVKFFEAVGIKPDIKNIPKLSELAIDLINVFEIVLNEREKEIIIERYFPGEVVNFKNRIVSLEEVGNKYNLTRERIRQIEKIGLNKIKQILINFEPDFIKKDTLRKYCKDITPEEASKKSGLSKVFKYLNANNIYFTGQVIARGEDWLRSILNNLNISRFNLEKYIDYIFLEQKKSKPKNYDESVYTQSIDVLNLSYRSHNCLIKNEIYNIKLLTQITEDELYKIKNLGTRSANEIIIKLKTYLKPEEEVASSSGIDLNMNINKLNFSIRITNVFKTENISTLRDILELSEDDLYHMTNLGQTSINEILQKLENLDLSLSK